MPSIRITLAMLLGFLLLLSWLAPAVRAQDAALAPGSTAQFDAAGEKQLVDLINASRAEQGLPPFSVDSRLTQAARKHTDLMVQHNALSHEFPGEPPLDTRISNDGLPSDRQAENVDLDQTVRGAHQSLMLSPPHRANILDADYNVIGVGVLRSGANLYVTEDFARRLPQYSEPQAENAAAESIRQYQKAHSFPPPLGKPTTELRRLACDMALNDSLDMGAASRLPGVHGAFAWTAGDPGKLPQGIDRVLGPGLAQGYSLGACFAPSVSHPGGLYWLVMVFY